MPSHLPVRRVARAPGTLVSNWLLPAPSWFADDEGEFESRQHVRDAHEYLDRLAVERGILSLPLTCTGALTVTHATTGTKSAETGESSLAVRSIL